MSRLLRAITIAALAVLAFGAAPVAAQEPASPPTAPSGASTQQADPIVSVHGYTVDGGMRFYFRSLRDAGYRANRIFGFEFDARFARSPSNRVHARALETYIREVVLPSTGAEQVDVIAHSMGSLVTRWCITVLGCGEVIDDFVSVGGPNHGTDVANLCFLPFDAACTEMRPGSAFLERLNRGDETPGDVEYTTIRSGADWVIEPTSSVMLAGATNHHVPGFSHSDLVRDPMADPDVGPRVRDLVLAALD